MSGYPSNPDSTNAVDASEVDVDKPEGLFISAYTESSHLEMANLDTGYRYTEEYTLNWQDGQGGKATDNQKEGYVNGTPCGDYISVTTWPATSWPQPTQRGTEQWHDNLNSNKGTNADLVLLVVGTEQCEVKCRPYVGETTQTWTRRAQTQYSLRTGGKVALGVKNLWVVSGGAMKAEVIAGGINGLPYNQDVTNIPCEQIQIGTLGHLDASGNLYVVLPNGDPPVTPDTDSPFYDNMAPYATEYPVTILANGQVLNPENTNNVKFCVGQAVTFGLGGLDGLPIQSTDIKWKLDGDFVNQSSTNSAGCISYTKNPDLLKNLVVSPCWWVSGNYYPPATNAADVGGTITLTNGQKVEISANGKFSMYRPRAKITPQTASVGIYTVNGNQYVIFYELYKQGIIFSNTIDIPFGFSGLTNWIQVNSSPVTKLQDTNSVTHVKSQDGPGPYGDYPIPYSKFLPGTTIPIDNPGQLLPNTGYTRVEASDNFEMWMMFEPPGGIAVPLRAVNWSWGGSATNALDILWMLESDPGNHSVNPVDFDTQTFPLWNSDVHKFHFIPPLN